MNIGLLEYMPQLDASKHTVSRIELLPQSKWLWREALLQKQWGVCIYPDDNILREIMKMAFKMTLIQSMFTEKIEILSWYRCDAYNKIIGGAPKSYHRSGQAIDFAVPNMSCDSVREILRPELDRLEIRLQNHPKGTTWCHVDNGIPGLTGRFFT